MSPANEMPPAAPTSVGRAPALLLGVALLGAWLAGAARADVTLELIGATGEPGERVELPLELVSDEGVAAVQLDLSFDATRLDVEPLVAGPALVDHLLDSEEIAAGRLRILAYSPTNASLGAGALATVAFTIRAGAPAGSVPVTIEGLFLADPTARPLSLSSAQADGSVDVESVIDCESDVDLDGSSHCVDNCPFTGNADQADGDGDGIGDACEPLVFLRLGEATSAAGGERVAVPLLLDSGRQCVASASFTVEHDSAALTWAGTSAERSDCVVETTATDGLVDVDVLCPSGLDGRREIAHLMFDVAVSPLTEVVLLACAGVQAEDCAGESMSLDVGCTAGAVLLGCRPGDLHPDGFGDGELSLADWLLGHRKLDGSVPTLPRDLDCADLGALSGCADSDGAVFACPAGAGSLDSPDLVALRRLLNTTARPGCVDCLADVPTGSPRLPGDVAPRGAPDETLSVQDILVLLRWAVGLEGPPTSEELLRADVAPAMAEQDLTVVLGDGSLDVNDVIQSLRAAVGLDRLAWPARRLLLRLDDAVEIAAFSAVLSGWPAWASADDFESDSCAFGGLDVAGATWALTCAPAAAPTTGPTDLARLSYRAAEAVHPRALRLDLELIDESLDPVIAGVSLEVAP